MSSLSFGRPSVYKLRCDLTYGQYVGKKPDTFWRLDGGIRKKERQAEKSLKLANKKPEKIKILRGFGTTTCSQKLRRKGYIP